MESKETISRREFFKILPSQVLDNFRTSESSVQGEAKAKIIVDNCLAWTDNNCQHCYLACPLRDRAIKMIDQKPVIVNSLCDGCRECLLACSTVNNKIAIEMIPVP